VIVSHKKNTEENEKRKEQNAQVIPQANIQQGHIITQSQEKQNDSLVLLSPLLTAYR
jgi:hypothetical protein